MLPFYHNPFTLCRHYLEHMNWKRTGSTRLVTYLALLLLKREIL